MKKIIVLVVLVLVAASLCMSAPTEGKVNVRDAEDKIVMAAGHFFSGQNCKDGKAGLHCLMDAVKIMLPGSGFSAEINKKFDLVITLAGAKGDLHKDTIAALHDLFKTVYRDKEIAFPTSVTTVDGALAYGKEQMCIARDFLKKGNYAESTRVILKIAVMVSTPIEKKSVKK